MPRHGSANAYGYGSVLLPGKAEDWGRKAGEALAQARKLSPESPQVLIAEAAVSRMQMHWREADAFYFNQLPGLLKKYGDNNPALQPTGTFLMHVGRIREAIDILERARSADPLNQAIANSLGTAYMANGNLQAALAEYDRAMQHTRLIIFSGNALIAALASRDRQEIDKRLNVMVRDTGSSGQDINAKMARFLDNPSGAPSEIRRLATGMSAVTDPLGLDVLAIWAGYYQDPELQLQLMQDVGPLTRSSILPATLWTPIYTDARKLPGFKDLLRKLGLVDYWRATGKWADFCHPVGDDDFECK